MNTRTRPFRAGAEDDQPVVAGASEKQLGFIRSLMGERELTTVQRAEAEEKLESGLTKNQASAWIGRLLDLPKVSKPEGQRVASTPLPDVPAGRYAVTGTDGSVDFYKVDRPTEGRWEGYTFVKLLVADGGFGDDLSEQRIAFKASRTILERILEAGVRPSMERYGKAIGRCGHCGRTLTDNESIERGIGPVCAGRMGWGE